MHRFPEVEADFLRSQLGFWLQTHYLPPPLPALGGGNILGREERSFFKSGYLIFAPLPTSIPTKTPHLFSFYLAGNEEVEGEPLKSNNPNKKPLTGLR